MYNPCSSAELQQSRRSPAGDESGNGVGFAHPFARLSKRRTGIGRNGRRAGARK